MASLSHSSHDFNWSLQQEIWQSQSKKSQQNSRERSINRPSCKPPSSHFISNTTLTIFTDKRQDFPCLFSISKWSWKHRSLCCRRCCWQHGWTLTNCFEQTLNWLRCYSRRLQHGLHPKHHSSKSIFQKRCVLGWNWYYLNDFCHEWKCGESRRETLNGYSSIEVEVLCNISTNRIEQRRFKHLILSVNLQH